MQITAVSESSQGGGDHEIYVGGGMKFVRPPSAIFFADLFFARIRVGGWGCWEVMAPFLSILYL